MRIVIQRVSRASVTINQKCKAAIQQGFMILVGIEEQDTQEDADWLCKKVVNLRVFDDEQGIMNNKQKRQQRNEQKDEFHIPALLNKRKNAKDK